MLFALSNAKTKEDPACTSKLCEWNVPARHTVKPRPMSTLSTGKPTVVSNTEKHSAMVPDTKCMTSFDPRHPNHRQLDVPRTLTHLRELKDIFPNTGIILIFFNFI